MMLVIDLEATCDEGDGLPASDMEVIEIGAVWATAEGTVLDTFQALVRPVVRPQLTPFCRQLTNIQQADVDGAELFPAVAARLASFAQRHQAPGATWGSWGQFDAKQLARDCERHGIESPLAAFEHVNKESGTRYYILHADASNADVLYVYEMYENQDGMNAHMAAEWFKPFGASLAPFMGGRPEMTFLTPIAGKGL